MNAKFIQEFKNDGTSIYYSRTKKDTWPGYDDSLPLGKKGYWFGNDSNIKYIGPSKIDLEDFIEKLG